MTDRRLRIAVTAGDPAGIGPEIVAKALRERRLQRLGDVVVFAEGQTFDAACMAAGVPALPRVDSAAAAPGAGGPAVLAPVDVEAVPADFELGRPSAWTGRVAATCVERAARAALAREVDAVVTAPLAKVALQAAGVEFPGHTEMLASLAGVDSVAMMFVAKELRLTLATIHVALADVPRLLTADSLLEKMRLTRDALLHHAGIPSPRLAVLGLNPHAGESGMFGREEIAVVGPAIQRARERGWRVDGPFPADAFFARQRRDFDGVLAMYHDQGLIPVKLLGGGQAVNVTLGLPFVRTSPDHGTAFDIAGRNVASAESLVAAAALAAEWSGGA
ncbi:MAG: 4-hydroxythreonine-4-phosphate dehydrogenase PdxA [bacterium]